MNYPTAKITPSKKLVFCFKRIYGDDHMIKKIPKIEQNYISPEIPMNLEFSPTKCLQSDKKLQKLFDDVKQTNSCF